MWRLALSTIRAHRASFAGTFAVMALAAALLSGVGTLMESGIRGGAEPHRYAAADVVVTTSRPLTGRAADRAATSPSLEDEVVQRVRSVPGVDRAAADVTFPLTATGGQPLAGHGWSAFAALHGRPGDGVAPEHPGEVVLDATTGHHVGDRVTLRYGGLGREYRVVGTVAAPATSARPPAAYLTDKDVLALWPRAAGSAAVVVSADRGVDAAALADRIERTVPGVDALTGRARGAAEHPQTAAAGQTLTALAGSLAGVTLAIVLIVLASTMSLVVQQRRRELALLRAVGATARQLRRMLGLELVLVAAVAAPLGALPGVFGATLLKPLLVAGGVVPDDFGLAISPLPALVAVGLVVPVALAAALTGARRHLRVSPTDALREAAVESPQVGRSRRVAAVVCAAAGLLSALSPVVLPGSLGGATAGMSALLLVGAAALAGPLLVSGAFARLDRRLRGTGGPSVQLALANSRGFSRRLTSVVVPLALVVAFGAVQNLVGATIGTASTEQSRAGLHADLVVDSATGIHPRLVDELEHLPGVRASAPMTVTTAQVKTGEDDEDLPFLDRLSWESVPLRVVPETGSTDLLDLGVSKGSLTALSAPDTLAVSRDARAEYGLSLGDTVRIRYADGDQATARVVAEYDRGLGFGPVVIGQHSYAAHAPDALTSTVLLAAEPGRTAALSRAVRDLGLPVTDTAAFSAAATQAEARSQGVSGALLLVLLAFIVLGALNSLVMTTLGRRAEFGLLQVVGTSRAQVLRTSAVEAVVVAVAAVGLGIAALLPAVVGVTYGFAHAAVPALSWGLLAGLVLTATVVPLLGLPAITAVATRGRPSSRRS